MTTLQWIGTRDYSDQWLQTQYRALLLEAIRRNGNTDDAESLAFLGDALLNAAEELERQTTSHPIERAEYERCRNAVMSSFQLVLRGLGEGERMSTQAAYERARNNLKWHRSRSGMDSYAYRRWHRLTMAAANAELASLDHGSYRYTCLMGVIARLHTKFAPQEAA